MTQTFCDICGIPISDDEKYTFPKNVEFYGYVSDKISRFAKGIEEEFAEYWFMERCNIDDSDKS